MRKNTRHSYGSVARALHWTIALLFLMAYCAVYYRHWFTVKDTAPNWIALQLHLSLGITIAAFVVLRVIWRLKNVTPELPAGPRWEHRAAHLGHALLYVVMIVMPITGYLGTKVNTEYFLWFDIPKFPDTALFAWLVSDTLGMSFEQWEKPIDFLHKNAGAYFVWVLILVHVAAALYHHLYRKDDTLLRMWRGARD